MKFKDRCKEYGYKFVFTHDTLFLPYMVIKDLMDYAAIVDLRNGTTATFWDDDKIMNDDVMAIHCEIERPFKKENDNGTEKE